MFQGLLAAFVCLVTASVASAQAAAAPAGPNTFEMFIPFIFIFVIFYFLIIRPQSKKAKEQSSFVSALKRGDEIITTSGILGRIEGLSDQFVTLEIADGVRVKMLRTMIASSQKLATEGKA